MSISVSFRLTTAMLVLPLVCFTQSPPAGMSQRAAARILEQATWGPTAADIQDLQTKGFDKWFDDQVSAAYSAIPTQPLLNSARTTNTSVAPDVTTFTESDFSRTFQPTSNDGSDHAWGSHHLVMGGAVKAGDIYGKLPEFVLGGPDDADTRGRWIPSTALYQYGATLCSWFGVTDADLAAVFPNFANFGSQKLSFLG